ncbi:1-phosphofructokinase family hexose kinase [Metabacillus sp. Hm71]|uniref:1-phosphofructokinase family hexose kinase n=1 Tax=Metabacillus sp. Hm71 TaxID=3450743 RepID=UPI003F41F8D7
MIHVVCPNPALDRTIFLNNFYQNGVSRAEKSMDLLGGKGFNVIRSFLVNERPSFLVHTFLGGYTGDYLKSMIDDEQIDCIVTPTKETTRICSIIVDQTLRQAHLINESGPKVDRKEKNQFIENLVNQVNQEDYVIFSGSLPGGIDSDFYYNLIDLLEKKGAKCILDSSGVPLTEGVKAEPWLTKVNEFEFLELVDKKDQKPTEEVIVSELKTLSNHENFIVTLGGKGTIAKFDHEIYKIVLPKIQVTNATASGDIFLGALVKELNRSETIEEALRSASAYSLTNCLYWYPKIGVEELDFYTKQIDITKLGGMKG